MPLARSVRSISQPAPFTASAIGALLGRPGAADIVDHGMQYIWKHHRDRKNGGYFWSLNNDGPVDSTKQGYGHAFVLLAGSSAKAIGHPLADGMIADVTEVLNTRFWEAQPRRDRRGIQRRLVSRSTAAPIAARTPTCT